MTVTSFENDKLVGKVNVDRPGILYMSVPDDDGWTVKVDGVRVKKRSDVDIAFMGVDLNEGEHTIELEYHTRGFWLGVIVSIAGIIMLIVILIMRKHSQKNHISDVNDEPEVV